MKRLIDRCPICGQKLKKFGLCPICKENLILTPYYAYKIDGCSDILVAFQYAGIGKDLIRKFKFEGDLYLVEIIGDLMIEKLLKSKQLKDFANISYVPMTTKKENKRGFNQAYELAKYIACNLDLNLIDSFEKIKETKDQVGLNERQRKENLKGAFKIKNYSKDIIIVDDVITTGSTIEELAKAAKEEKIKTMALLASTESN